MFEKKKKLELAPKAEVRSGLNDDGSSGLEASATNRGTLKPVLFVVQVMGEASK